eukprot:TRINITY_DN469_c0_g1_i1.p1 TRINITY_DN469_c0_g1~~TRINITY_DN469_c0_g1_i1.p1  ORF type:complete len:134 (+),score=40.82 TRINITY_DN469_c0_g1_i1:75-476(+)
MALRNYLVKFGEAFPSANPRITRLLGGKFDLSVNQVSQVIRSNRVDFWWRTTTGFSSRYQAAKAEVNELLCWIRSTPLSQLTVRQVVSGGIIGVQIWGCFKLGEMYGRGSVSGYDTSAIQLTPPKNAGSSSHH